MWFGTEQGLNKFDGFNFTVYTYIPEDTSGISSNWVWCVFEDSEGIIWIGTGNGLNKFDPITERFSHYFHDEKRGESLSDNDVTCVLEDSYGYIWIGTGHGLNQFDRKTQNFKHFIHEPNNPASISLNYISCLYEDSRGDLWIGTGSITAETSGGINKFDRKTEKFISFKFEPSQYGHSNWITDIDEDTSGSLWIGTDAGLRKYDSKTNTFTHHYYHGSTISSLASNTIKSIFFDRKDNLWVGSWGGGLNLLDESTGEFIQYKYNPQDIYSLSNNKVQTIYEDRNGSLWIGTKGGGINTINSFSNFFRHYRKYVSEDKMQHVFELNNIRSIYEDRSGKLWLGSEGEINILDRSASVSNWTTILSLDAGTYVNSITEDDSGKFWIGTAHGLIKYDPLKKQEKWHILYEPESLRTSAFFVYTTLIDQKGLLWIGTQQGLYRFDRQNDTYTRFVHDPELRNTLSYNRVISILENSFGTLWVGTIYGLNKFDPVNQNFLNFQVNPQVLDHLKYNDIRVMCEDKLGILWIGTAYGLKMLDQTTENFRLFTQKDGLPDNVINGLLPDDNGNIWISTNSGVSTFNPGTKEFKNYDYWDGIQNTTFNSGACFKNKNGEMLFGGNNGLTTFHPNSIRKNMLEPPIVITSFKKFNEEVRLDTSISWIKQLIFPSNENVFSFEFSALNFMNPRKNQFAYKMEGFIDNWIYLGNKHDVTFTNLSPGKYVFRVKGSNNDGIWNEEGASIRVIITPPWWQTVWAYVSYALLFITSIFWVIGFEVNRNKRKAAARLREEQERYRVETAEHRAVVAELQARAAEAEKEIEKEQMRARIASDLHDEIGSNLSTIAIVSQMAADKLKAGNVEKRRLQKIPRLARQTAESMRDIIWFINPENDSMDRLLVKMRQTANMMLENVDFTFDLPPESITFTVDVNFRRNLYLVFKECLQNIIKHAQATRVEIAITLSNKCLQLRVSDNGVGFDIQPEHPGNGIRNFQQRAAELGGTIEISSNKGNGTTIKLAVKIP